MTAQEALTGSVAGEVLTAAVAAGGGRLLSWRANQVDGATVAYRARVAYGGVDLEETFAATTAEPIPAGATVLRAGDEQVGVWRAAHDPALPGMRTAMDPLAAAELFRRCGLDSGPVQVRIRSYRPLKRALVEVVGAHSRLFLKVVPPAKVRPLHERHRLLTGAGVPAPRSLGWSDDGLVVLEALPGRSLRSQLSADPAELVALLDRLPAALLDAPERSSWLARTEYYAGVVGAAAPELAGWATDLAGAVVTSAYEGPVVPVHGDFYEAQVMVDAVGNVTGLLDVDTAGPGDRLDDLGCLLGHLAVLAQVLPERAAAIDGFGAACLTVFDRTVDPRQLRLRTAAVVLSLATGPHRVQEAGWRQATRDRLQLAERWVQSADRAHREERNHHVSNA